MKVPNWLTLSCLGLPLATSAAVDARPAITAKDIRQADIQLIKVGDILTISPRVLLAKGKDRIGADVELLVEKKGPSGTIATRQAGAVRAGLGDEDAIARVQINVTNEDAITATLTIRSGDHILAERQRLWTGGMASPAH